MKLVILFALISLSFNVDATTATEREKLVRVATELSVLEKDVKKISISASPSSAEERGELYRVSKEILYIVQNLQTISSYRRVDDLEAFDYEVRISALVSFNKAIERHIQKSQKQMVVFNYQRLLDDIRNERSEVESHLIEPYRTPRSIEPVKLGGAK